MLKEIIYNVVAKVAFTIGFIEGYFTALWMKLTGRA